MSRGGPNLSRRQDLKRAIAAAKPEDELDLQTLATIWGVSKPTFVNTLRQIERQFEVPHYREGDRGVHFYPAKKMLGVMLAYEQRNDDLAKQKQEKTAKILGQHRVDQAAAMAMPINELATLSRVAAETEARERDQRLYIHRDEVARVAGSTFSILSGYLSQLEAHIDPNGLLTKETRAVLRDGGKAVALRIHAEMADMLSPDARPQSSKRARGRAANDRSGRAPPRRKGGGTVARKGR